MWGRGWGPLGVQGGQGATGPGNEIRVLRRGHPQHHGAAAVPLSARSWQPVGATHGCLVPDPDMDVSGISRQGNTLSDGGSVGEEWEVEPGL